MTKILTISVIILLLAGGVFFLNSWYQDFTKAQGVVEYSETWQAIGGVPNCQRGTAGILYCCYVPGYTGLGCSYPGGWVNTGTVSGTVYKEIWQAQGVNTGYLGAECGGSVDYEYSNIGEGYDFPSSWSVKGSIGGGNPYTLEIVNTSGQGGWGESAYFWLRGMLPNRIGVGPCSIPSQVDTWDAALYYRERIDDCYGSGCEEYSQRAPDYREYSYYEYGVSWRAKPVSQSGDGTLCTKVEYYKVSP